MRYLGGKSRTRKQIAAFLELVRPAGAIYLEPFVGGAWVLQEMTGPRIASDYNASLIALYRAVQAGWVPPEVVTEQEWRHWWHLRGQFSDDPMHAFCGFGCSFGGKWFGGYARDNFDHSYAASSSRSLLAQRPQLADVMFRAGDYRDWNPQGCLVYCDPPYIGTTGYGAAGAFDHAEFWATMREWSKSNVVVVSEYQAPPDFPCVLEIPSRMGLRNAAQGQEVRTERLFMAA